MIDITVDNRTVLEALQALQAKAGNLGPALREIGEDLQDSTLKRFETSTGPDGQPWEANTQATLDAYLRKLGGAYDKAGNRTGTKKGWGEGGAKAGKALGAKRPLIGESRALSTTIDYRVSGNTLEVGSPMEYAAMQQFGGTKGEFPNLWGDIPARPFLGVSEQDEGKILDVLQRYFSAE